MVSYRLFYPGSNPMLILLSCSSSVLPRRQRWSTSSILNFTWLLWAKIDVLFFRRLCHFCLFGRENIVLDSLRLNFCYLTFSTLCFECSSLPAISISICFFLKYDFLFKIGRLFFSQGRGNAQNRGCSHVFENGSNFIIGCSQMMFSYCWCQLFVLVRLCLPVMLRLWQQNKSPIEG